MYLFQIYSKTGPKLSKVMLDFLMMAKGVNIHKAFKGAKSFNFNGFMVTQFHGSDFMNIFEVQ